MSKELDLNSPNKLQFLAQVRERYKVIRGGRCSTKSWTVGRTLLALGIERSIRVLCAREIQTSIKQSVHQLLADQIKNMGLEEHYLVLETEIRGKLNDTLFSFAGLSGLTVTQLKSYEGYNYCWVEEGQAISEASWKVLTPTIRQDDADGNPAEIWVTYNPDLETDATHQRFTINPPKNCINVLMNWRDNPWFSDTMNQDRLHCKETDPDNYDNIWEGECKPAVEGAIFFKQVAEMERQGRICDVPYDPLLKVHLVADQGWRDKTAVGMVQHHPGGAVRIINYYEADHTTWDADSAILKENKYNWGQFFLPHDAFAGRKESGGKSTASILRKLGWKIVPHDQIKRYQLSVEEGIKATRLLFSRFYVDKSHCADLVECWKRYRRPISNAGVTGAPVHDEFSHGGDMTRYIACNIDSMTNEDEHDAPFTGFVGSYPPLDSYIGL